MEHPLKTMWTLHVEGLKERIFKDKYKLQKHYWHWSSSHIKRLQKLLGKRYQNSTYCYMIFYSWRVQQQQQQQKVRKKKKKSAVVQEDIHILSTNTMTRRTNPSYMEAGICLTGIISNWEKTNICTIKNTTQWLYDTERVSICQNPKHHIDFSE